MPIKPATLKELGHDLGFDLTAMLIPASQVSGAIGGSTANLVTALNVKVDYGATGDGVTDDTAAIQAAINAGSAANAVVFFPAGTYIVSSLTVAGNFHALGEGKQTATLQHKAKAFNPLFYRGGGLADIANVSIENLVISGNGRDAHTTVNGTQVVGGGGNLTVVDGSKIDPAAQNVIFANVSPFAFTFTGVSGNVIQGISPGATFTNGLDVEQPASKDAIFLSNVDDVRIQNCTLKNFYNSGLALFGYRRAWISDNYIVDCCCATNTRNGMTFADSAAHPGRQTDLFVSRNIVEGGTIGGKTGAIIITDDQSTSATTVLRALLDGNIIRNWPTWSGIQTESGYIQSALFTNNQVYGCLVGIAATETENVYSGVSNSNHIVMANNLIDSTGLSNATGFSFSGSGIALTGNMVRVSGPAITMGSSFGSTSNDDISIVGNRFQHTGVDTVLAHSVLLSNNARNVVISDNSFDRLYARVIGSQVAVTTVTVDNVTDIPAGGGTIRPQGSATTRTYTSVTQATRAGAHATINGLSSAITVNDGDLIYFGTHGNAIVVVTADDLLIANNSIANTGKTAINLQSGVFRCGIFGNKILRAGSEMNGQIAIWLDGSGVALGDLQVFDNVIQDPSAWLANGLFVRGAPNTQLRGNYFNNGTGASPLAWSTFTAADITIDRDNRKGPTHVPNGGISTSTPGAVATVNIAHGLLTTPTLFSVDRGDANARGAPAYHVTADATNVILTFASNLTAATAYTWNWTARV